MITLEQAKTEREFHANGGCSVTYGPRRGRKIKMEAWHRNGATKLWVRNPNKFKVPVKHGMYGPYNYVTDLDAEFWHTRSDCAVLKELYSNPHGHNEVTN